MHKQITISGDSTVVQALGAELPGLEGIIALSLQPGTSVKPRGDTLVVHTLNKTADEVLRRAAGALRAGHVSVVLGESSAFITRSNREQIAQDDDEALWEEMESQLRNHGRISINYVVLMFLGGAIASAAFTLEPVGQAIAFVGASITSPAFEPLAKVSQGIALRRGELALHGLGAAVVGYGVLVAAAALTFAVLAASGEAHGAQLATQPFARALSTFEAHTLLPSACAALAGGLMVASLRDSYVVGPLMILALIPAASLVGSHIALGEFPAAVRVAGRALLDIVFVVALVALVFWWKQRTKHRRSLLP